MKPRALDRVVWALGLFLLFSVAGCGLELDYGGPNPVHDDGGRADGGGIDAGTSCTTGCDDGLRCTADQCVDGTCQHTDTCTGALDCVRRAGVGECRRACTSASDCDDGIACTDDVCVPEDGHCGHTSNCQADRPVCLDNGACAPDHCSEDAECQDSDLCNGEEHCVSGTCRGGAPVRCSAPVGCRSDVCDPETGTCLPVLDGTMCDDHFDCTADLCGTDGACTHVPDDTLCGVGDLCNTHACTPSTATDPSGCSIIDVTACPIACGTSIACDPTNGLCDYSTACPAGQVCRADGCHSATSCTSDTACTSIRGPDGCNTHCIGGMCQPLLCPLPMPGGCGQLVIDSATGCAAGDHCQYVANPTLCDDGDDLTLDTCNPDTFACTHTCPAAAPNDCVTYALVGGHCIPSFDSTTCTRLHGTVGSGAGDCARSACVGHDPMAGGGADGCRTLGADSLCSDGADCTTDVCVVDGTTGVGACARSPTGSCDDGMACTIDACDPAHADLLRDRSGCTHTPDDTPCVNAAGSLQCARAFCAQTGTLGNMLGASTLPTGCAVSYMPNACGLLSNTICTLDGQCTSVPCSGATGGTCNDGVACNGTEVCDGLTRHCAQTMLLPACTGGTTGCMDVCTASGCVPPQTPMCGIVSTM
jgi:hypothetical protein